MNDCYRTDFSHIVTKNHTYYGFLLVKRCPITKLTIGTQCAFLGNNSIYNTITIIKSFVVKDKKLQQGFTLIELAIVVAFIMALALLAYPIYADYVKKAKVTEGLALATTAKMAVRHHTANNVPLTSVWTPPAPTDVVADISIYLTDTTGISISSNGQVLTNLPARQMGEIVITFSPDIAPANHNEIVLSPRLADPDQQVNNGHELPLGSERASKVQAITWECNSAAPPNENRGTHGNLDAKLAPADCRV